MRGARNVRSDYPSERYVGPWERLARTAAGQEGIVRLDHLFAAGLTAGAIKYRTRVGQLHLVHRGVYALGHGEITPTGRMLAAVWAIGLGAVLSHLSAAFHWGFLAPRPGPIDVSVARRVRAREGIRVHQVTALPAHETLRHHGIPVTAPARTLLDLAATRLPERQLRRAVNQALIDRRTSLPHLQTQLGQYRGRPGTGRLRTVLDAGAAPTRSFLEDLLVPLLRRADLPPYATNTKVLGFEVDVLFPDHCLILEADGARYHDNPVARAEDHAKQAALEAAGYTVLRITWHQAVHQPAQTLQRIRRALYRSVSAR